MNVVFSTQGQSLKMFEALHTELNVRTGVERAGYIVADRWSYARWIQEQPHFETRAAVLKEWEITRPPFPPPDVARLARAEQEIGGSAGLFGAIVADRRLFMGPDCTYSQDYRRRFSDDQLLSILQRGLEATERMFDKVQPDVLFGFICVTMMDYLAYQVARSRGVQVMNLRPTRIGDRVAFHSTLNDPAPELTAAYERIIASGDYDRETPRAYIRRVREEHGRYEGVVRPSAKPVLGLQSRRRNIVRSAWHALRSYFDYRASRAGTDNHVPNPLRALAFAATVNPYRARAASRFLSQHYVDPLEMHRRRYAFFPLHTEPEVSLLVYGRPFVNQIEVIRELAMSLPADMLLLVKEHPWMVGKRSLGAYRKMLDIPRVRFVSPALEARELVKGADLVAVITGSIALEAAMIGRPVLSFGDCPYNLLPDSMVRRCGDLRHLPAIIAELLNTYHLDDSALEGYVAAVYETSAGVNLYSVLLGKRNVYAERSADYMEEVSRLADYAAGILNTVNKSPSRVNLVAW